MINITLQKGVTSIRLTPVYVNPNFSNLRVIWERVSGQRAVEYHGTANSLLGNQLFEGQFTCKGPGARLYMADKETAAGYAVKKGGRKNDGLLLKVTTLGSLHWNKMDLEGSGARCGLGFYRYAELHPTVHILEAWAVNLEVDEKSETLKH